MKKSLFSTALVAVFALVVASANPAFGGGQDQDIVDTVIDEVFAHRIMPVGHEGYFEFGFTHVWFTPCLVICSIFEASTLSSLKASSSGGIPMASPRSCG